MSSILIYNIVFKREHIETRLQEELRKRDYFFHPQLNTNTIMERDLGPDNRRLIFNGKLIYEVMISEGDKAKRQSRF